MNDRAVEVTQMTWQAFIATFASKEAAGEAIYKGFLDVSTSFHQYFQTPKAIQAVKLMNGLNQIIFGLDNPASLKTIVETIGFGHLALEVTVPRVVLFREAITDLFTLELGSKFTTEAFDCLTKVLNYAGGAIIYIREAYAERIELLRQSWSLCKQCESSQQNSSSDNPKVSDPQSVDMEHGSTKSAKTSGKRSADQVPSTFPEMFKFNAAVMGFGSCEWMNEVLACFDNIAMNAANTQRLTEECDFLLCRISKVTNSNIRLADFRSCMLAALRSLLPKSWTTQHEVAWSWLWENVARFLSANLGMPPKWSKAYGKLLDGMDESIGHQIRRDIFVRFFKVAPAGQNFFKQSTTYLNLVATKVIGMIADVFTRPNWLVDELSAVGLRHVGYGVPVEFMPPFASVYVEVLQGVTTDQVCVDGIRWSMALIAKTMTRAITEGSTVVMKAISANTIRDMKKAVSVAPRAERARWLLLVEVGTQHISPLGWAIKSSATEAAGAMIHDLCAIRADRDQYYYGADDMFARHPDIVKMILDDTPGLLPDLFDGCIWRSRHAVNGYRRVNYFIKHLLVDPDGQFPKNLEWIGRSRDPKMVIHPVPILLSNLVWNGVACRCFLTQKMWFVLNLCVFTLSQSVLADPESTVFRFLLAILRLWIYGCCMVVMLREHIKKIARCVRSKDVVVIFRVIPIPRYLQRWQEAANLFFACCLLVMCCTEPILHCLTDKNAKLFSPTCKAATTIKFFPYSVVSMLAMLVFWLYIIDFTVLSGRALAYVLVCDRVLTEFGLFIIALICVLITFSSSLSCIDNPVKGFHGIHNGSLTLWRLVAGVISHEEYEVFKEQPAVIVSVLIFLVLTVVFLANLLVAQLKCAYGAMYADMVGYASLKRITLIVETMPLASPKRWSQFVERFRFDQCIDFNEGDVGLANGIQVFEPASAFPTSKERICRYGGATAPQQRWPEEEEGAGECVCKFERLEGMVKMALERVTTRKVRLAKESDASHGSQGGSRVGSMHSVSDTAAEE
eukprot:TRINITY_DN5294_c1_g1_i1.p1 TRINITY_DN5294_c1_g1~~TRINITY_DN5294_c1_g1_i1.p1  ORF type:complete len:1098 (-),score=168.07 TRINITY_DN5294_c1_g1_i1:130-3180(-)